MMRLIDADALIEIIKEEKEDNDAHCRLCMDATIDIIDEQPTVEARPVVHGEWLEVKGCLSWFYKCSECGMLHEYKRNFCHDCGADMRGDKNG